VQCRSSDGLMQTDLILCGMFARAARCYMCVILCPDAFNVGRVPAKIGNVASFSIGMNMVFKVAEGDGERWRPVVYRRP